MERLELLHARLPTTLLLMVLTSIAWLGWCAYRARLDRPAQVLLGITQWLVVATALLGLGLLPAADLRVMALHLIYALIALGILPFTTQLNRERDERSAAVNYLAALSVLLVVASRAAATGG